MAIFATRICIFLDSDAISKYNGRNELGTRRDEAKLTKGTDSKSIYWMRSVK